MPDDDAISPPSAPSAPSSGSSGASGPAPAAPAAPPPPTPPPSPPASPPTTDRFTGSGDTDKARPGDDKRMQPLLDNIKDTKAGAKADQDKGAAARAAFEKTLPKEMVSAYKRMEQGEKDLRAGKISSDEYGKMVRDAYSQSLKWHEGNKAKAAQERQAKQNEENQRRAQQDAAYRKDVDRRTDNYRGEKSNIDKIAGMSDPVARNHAITAKYHEQSEAMRKMIPGQTNWATVAQHASSVAGKGIREEMTPTGTRTLLGLGQMAGGLGTMMMENPLDASARMVAEGNKTVFQDIAPQNARFIEMFKGDTARDERKLAEFNRGFGPGQDNLKGAFNNYYNAMFEKDPKKRDESMVSGNVQVAMHEQARLQDYIKASMPWGLRGLSTSHLVDLSLPNENLNVGHDIPALSNGAHYPANLQSIDNPQLRSLLNRYGANSLSGSAAGDWTEFGDRMRFISNLMRSRHGDTSLFASPE